QTAPALSEVIKNGLNKYSDSLKSKLIMQTYDGAAVMSGHINGLQTLIRQDYPFAFFFHCAAHRLNLVLCQSALNIKEVKLFFSKISAFCTFSKPSSDRKAHFNAYGVDIPNPGETRWYYKSRTVKAISQGFDVIKIALTEITDNPQNWSDETVEKADGLLHSLECFLLCFLLELYFKILQKSSILYDILQDRSVHFSYAVDKMHDFSKHLCDAQAGGAPSTRSEQAINYKSLYFEVIDNIVAMTENRFCDVESFPFFDLVNPKIFPQWVDGTVLADKIQQLTEKYIQVDDLGKILP
ncbi:zinc finger MYM-type 1-like, partial [Paramuricea clavata]